VVCQRSRLAFDTAPSGHDVLLVRAFRFLVVVVVAGRGCHPLRAPLSPLLTTLVVLGALDGDDRWHCSAAAGDHFPTA
jgi:hypothetical protein